MNVFDLSIMHYVNQFSRHSWAFDTVVSFLSHNNLLKGGALITVIWWAWFKSDQQQSHNREHILSTLICCLIAESVSRVLSLTLPFRPRPLYEESLAFLIPYGVDKSSFDGWSSFPSDHAVLFFSLASGLLFISGKAGVFALAYVTLFVALPRIYLGIHFPTDIIAGAVIGVAITWLGNRFFAENKILKAITNWSRAKPDFFYPVFFMFTYQLIDMFFDARGIISLGYKLITAHG